MNNHFDAAAPQWDQNPIHLKRTEAIAAELEQMIEIKPNMKALEFGAGTGLLSFALADRFADILLVDNSEEMINICQSKIKAKNTNHVRAKYFDFENDELKGETFDIIYSQMVLHHVTEIDSVFSKIEKLLNPGGIVAIADLYEEDGGFHDYTFTGHKGFAPQELVAKFEKLGFEKVKYQKCFTIERAQENGETKNYPVFLMCGVKK